jgi:GT2 family glycosyltransferase
MTRTDVPFNPLEGERPELNIKMHDGSDEQVSIIIVHKDRPEYLNICLQSIAVASINNNYEVIVVDNGSKQETQDFLDSIEQDGIKVVRRKNEPDLYWGPAINKGVEKADKGSNYYIFMHCDVVVLNPSWIDLLVNISEARGAGLVGVELQSYYIQNQKVDFIQEYCMLMTKEAWQDIGPFPKEAPQIGPSFIMTLKAQNRGFKPQIMRNPIVHHYKIFSLDINEFERLTENAMTALPKLIREAQEMAREV